MTSIAVLVVTSLLLAFGIAPLYALRPPPPWLDEAFALAVLVLLAAMLAMTIEAMGLEGAR